MASVLLNKAVGFLLSPIAVAMVLAVVAFWLEWRGRRRGSMVVVVAAAAWLWIWSTTALYRTMGYGLERRYPPQLAEDMPAADAIVVLGGAMNGNTNLVYSEMWASADRVWHAARLYRAGKAPLVVPSGCGEVRHSVPLLLDLDVPREAIVVENEAHNTEQNALLSKKLLDGMPGVVPGRKHKILLVTSAWHMRRAALNFEHAGFEVVTAATDHEATLARAQKLSFWHFFPVEKSLYCNAMMWKEIAGYWLYRVKYAFAPAAQTRGASMPHSVNKSDGMR